MHCKKFFKSVMVVLMAFSVFFSAVMGSGPMYAAGQATQSDLAAAKKELQKLEGEKADVQEIIKAYEKKIALLNGQLDDLEAQVSALETQINELQSKIDSVNQEIASLEVQIKEKQDQFDAKYEEYCKRLRAMYVSGNVTNLEVLMTCEDMSAFLTRAEMVSSVSEQDAEALNFLMDTMEGIKKDQKALENKKEDLNTSKNSLEASKKTVEDNRAQLQTVVSEQASDKAERDAQLSKIEGDIDLKNDDISEMNRQFAATNTGGNYTGQITNGTGRMTHPCPGYTHLGGTYPRYASGGYHSGVDFCGPTGTTIVAADSGTVIDVQYLTTSYGKHLMIAHGNGIYTLYAHCSAIYVKPGQNVKKGERIAAVGETGNARGAHLHFEVRVGGSRYSDCVNPFKYM